MSLIDMFLIKKNVYLQELYSTTISYRHGPIHKHRRGAKGAAAPQSWAEIHFTRENFLKEQ